MKIKQIEQISDTEVRVTWGDGKIDKWDGDIAKNLLRVTFMKISEEYKIIRTERPSEYRYGTVKDINDEYVEFTFFDDTDIPIPTRIDFDWYNLQHYTFMEKDERKQSTAKERVETELDELSLKCRTLEMFVISEKFNELGYAQQYLLENQLGAMHDYEKCLRARLDCWDK